MTETMFRPSILFVALSFTKQNWDSICFLKEKCIALSRYCVAVNLSLVSRNRIAIVIFDLENGIGYSRTVIWVESVKVFRYLFHLIPRKSMNHFVICAGARNCTAMLARYDRH